MVKFWGSHSFPSVKLASRSDSAFESPQRKTYAKGVFFTLGFLGISYDLKLQLNPADF